MWQLHVKMRCTVSGRAPLAHAQHIPTVTLASADLCVSCHGAAFRLQAEQELAVKPQDCFMSQILCDHRAGRFGTADLSQLVLEARI